MKDRFERLYEISGDLYVSQAPVIVTGGVLLKDAVSDSVIIQLKFQSISEKIIKALKIRISALDVTNQILPDSIEYQYLDLNIRAGEEFGANKAILLPSNVTRSFEISGITIVFSDGNQWKCDNFDKARSLPTPKDLSTELGNQEIERQYIISTTPMAKYVPFETMSMWSCTCGEWNISSKCTKCGLTKQTVFSALNIDELKINAEKRIVSEKVQREEQERHEQEIAEELALKKEHHKKIAKKIKRRLVFVLLIVVLVLFFLEWIYPQIIKPNIAYKEANRFFLDEQYSEASKIFEGLGDYKDSMQLYELCVEQLALQEKYEQAMTQYENSYFALAHQIFASLGEYKDSADYAEKSKTKIVEVNNHDVLSLFPVIDYKISLQALCDIIGSKNCDDSIPSFRNGMEYRSYSFGDIFVLNGIASEVSFRFQCQHDDIHTVEKDGELIAMTWSCPKELANFQMYENLKQYITSIIGEPTKSATSENEYGETYSYFTYWGDMQLSYSSTLGDNVTLARSNVWNEE